MATVDGLSPSGAKILADQIERYWAERGGRVVTRVELSTVRGESRIACVLSDMINGMPRERYTK